VRFYTASHVLWIVAIAAASILLSVLSRRDGTSKSWLRAGLVIVMVGGELQRFYTDGMHFPDRMPLHLCNVGIWIATYACIRLSPLAGEFTYFVALAGAAMAVLTPDMGSHWPARFFVSHGSLLMTAIVLVAGRIITIRPRAVWRAFGMWAGYGVAVGLYNWKYGTNFAFLAHKPDGKTLFDLMGPWPYYLISLGVLGLLIFWLLSLPLRSTRVAADPQPIRGAESRAAAAAAAGSAAAIQPQS
jgi:hypothetical integral membrane protein (TIGR02206 family)